MIWVILRIWTFIVLFAGACAMFWGLLCLFHALTERTIRAWRWRIAQRRMWRELARCQCDTAACTHHYRRSL